MHDEEPMFIIRYMRFNAYVGGLFPGVTIIVWKRSVYENSTKLKPVVAKYLLPRYKAIGIELRLLREI